LGTRFQERLDRIELDPASFSELNALAAQVEQLDPQLGSNARQRLVNQYSQLTNAALHQPRMAAEDFQRIESAIKLLEVHHAAETDALRKLLANRMTDWQPVFELSPPVAALPAEFPARLVKLENQQLVAVPDSTATSSDATRVLTKLRCANMARCEVVFEEPWEQCFELGVILGGTMNAGTLSGYEFTLLTTSSKSDDLSDTSDAPAGSFAAARAANGILEMVIRRNGATIHRQSIAAASFKNGPLRLRASCEREKLTFQIQDAPPLVFLDPFPLSTAQGTFGVVWPQHVGVTRVQTWQRNPTAAISRSSSKRLCTSRRCA
jgi:hypothetical protein